MLLCWMTNSLGYTLDWGLEGDRTKQADKGFLFLNFFVNFFRSRGDFVLLLWFISYFARKPYGKGVISMTRLSCGLHFFSEH